MSTPHHSINILKLKKKKKNKNSFEFEFLLEEILLS